MDLTTAKALVIADSRDADPATPLTDEQIVADIRTYDHAEIDGWVETDVIEAGSETEQAYRMVLDATDEEIAAQRTATRVQTDDDADTDCL